MKSIAIAIAVASTGCAHLRASNEGKPIAPFIRIAHEHTTEVDAALRAWTPLGFRIGSTSVPCPLGWHSGDDPNCEIAINLTIVEGLRETHGTDALASRSDRYIAIDAHVPGRFRQTLALAHEIGHVVLFTQEHARRGIMGGTDVRLSDDDRVLACRTVGLGC